MRAESATHDGRGTTGYRLILACKTIFRTFSDSHSIVFSVRQFQSKFIAHAEDVFGVMATSSLPPSCAIDAGRCAIRVIHDKRFSLNVFLAFLWQLFYGPD